MKHKKGSKKMTKIKKPMIGKDEMDRKQYAISYCLKGSYKIDVNACLNKKELDEFVNSFGSYKKSSNWMQQLFDAGKYIINLENIILVEITEIPNKLALPAAPEAPVEQPKEESPKEEAPEVESTEEYAKKEEAKTSEVPAKKRNRKKK
ncbi:MAG: hypothetical protein HOE40_03985 [Candidatus Pacebacteria bacterium]|jgi:hypothetical protein|nr:hypothetical protein [Candidatus Paceibacterota bacterium]